MTLVRIITRIFCDEFRVNATKLVLTAFTYKRLGTNETKQIRLTHCGGLVKTIIWIEQRKLYSEVYTGKRFD